MQNYPDSEIMIALYVIGMRVFAEYYKLFKSYARDEVSSGFVYEKLLEKESFTLNSRKARTTKAKKLFTLNADKRALYFITRANNVSDSTKQKALELLEM